MTTKVPATMALFSSAIVQEVWSTTSATQNISGIFYQTGGIPVITDGGEVLTATITPTSASNYLTIEALLQCSLDATGFLMAALFRDSTTNAIAASCVYPPNQSPQWTYPNMIAVRTRVLAGSTAATTIRLRAGGSGGSVLRINQNSAAGQLFGGVAVTSLVVREVTP